MLQHQIQRELGSVTLHENCNLLRAGFEPVPRARIVVLTVRSGHHGDDVRVPQVLVEGQEDEGAEHEVQHHEQAHAQVLCGRPGRTAFVGRAARTLSWDVAWSDLP